MRSSTGALPLRTLYLPLFFIFSLAVAGSSPLTPIVQAPVGLSVSVPQGQGPVNAMNAVVGDLNGDGLPDVVLGVNFASPLLYLNNGTETPFQGVIGSPVAAGDSQQQAFIADVNADGHPDIVAVGFNSPTKIYLNNGTVAPFSGVGGISIGGSDTSTYAAIADVNGDGFPDIAVANTNHIPSRLYLSNGAALTGGSYSTVNIGTDLGYAQQVEIEM